MAMDEKSERVRNLLSSYYSNPGAPVPDSPASQASSREQPSARQPRSIGLDSTTFDSSRYIDQLLGTTRLPNLLQKHLEMSAEIKSLDSDMQMLVYENYNKFISATDTIRTMKSSVDDMDEKMQTLKQLIGSVASKSTQVNTKLQERHDQMEDLSRVRGLLIKMQAVFQLPKQLRAAIDQGALEIAVEKYADVAGLLKAYGHKGAFRKVNTEVQGCAKELTSLLRRRLDQPDADTAESISLLERMGEPPESLQDAYLSCVRSRVDSILSEAEAMPDNVNDSSADGAEGKTTRPEGLCADLPAFVVQLDQKFIAELSHLAASYSELFKQSGRQKLVQAARSLFGRYLHILRQRIHATSMQAIQSSAAAALRTPATTSQDVSSNWGAAELASALSTFATDASRLHSPLPELSAQDRAAEVVEKTVRQHIVECFQQLEKQVFFQLSDIQSSLSSQQSSASPSDSVASDARQMYEGYKRASKLLNEGIASILQAMKSYQQQSVILRSWQDVFVDLVQGHVQHLFLSLLQGIVSLGTGSANSAASLQNEGPASGELKPGHILMLARVVEFMESTSVVKVLELLAALFAGQGAAAGSEQPPAFVAGDVARRLGAGAQKLLEEYIKVKGSRVSAMLLSTLQTGPQDSGPARQEATHLPVNDLLTLLSQAEAEVSALLNKKSPASQPREGLPASSSGTALERNVARLFNHKAPLFGKLTLNQNSIMGGIVRFALKAFVEGIRLSVLSQAALQQLQQDIVSLRQALPRYLQGSEVNAMHILFDEALAAATERCSEPVLLDTAILEKSLAAQLSS